MDLHDWLLRSRFINLNEYKEIRKAQDRGSWSGVEFDHDGFACVPADAGFDVSFARKHPVGEVLNKALQPLAAEVYSRAKVKDLDELVLMWQQWHVNHLEPIVNYSTSCRFGRNIYVNQLEKKLVGWFVTNAKVRGNSIINNADIVVIPEGSSAFYVGMAIAAYRSRASVITSNGALYCEYLSNPALARSFADFHVVGGLADLDRDRHVSDNGGMFGLQSEGAYKFAITVRPAATVVIMPVSGFLPEEGPFALTEDTRALKLSIIRDSLDSQVRELVFVCDYSKHLETKMKGDCYGTPIMPPKMWRELLEKHRGRVSLVTSPPSQLRASLVHSPIIHPATRRSLDVLGTNVAWSAETQAYNKSARKFGSMFYDEHQRLMFHEVHACDDSQACELRQMAQHA